MEANIESSVIEFRDEGATPLSMRPFTSELRNQRPTLIIDNGSWQCRAGWSVDPKPTFSFYNLLAKQKGKKGEQEPILTGGDLGQIENLRWMIRSAFDSNVVVQYGYQEVIFDYTLANLGLGEETKLDMPLVLTEPLLNPAYSRKLMNELVFECYAFPHVAYGVDSLFGYYTCMLEKGVLKDGIIISVGNISTHIIPVLNGQMDVGHCRRIDLGGLNMTLYLQRLMQLKYPVHAPNITISRMEEIVHGYCFYAESYREELLKWRNREYYTANVLFFQLSFQVPTGPVATQEEIDARREENAQRLRDMNRRRQVEKLQQEETRLAKLAELQELVARRGQKNTKEDMKALGVKSLDNLLIEVQTLSSGIERTKQRLERKTLAVPAQESVTETIDPETIAAWVVAIKEQRQRIIDQRAQRKQRKTDLGKRRSYASQQRMKILTQLASGRVGKKAKKEDTFGKDDEDWLVYREINKEAGDSDSEDERVQLDEMEGLLVKHDAAFRREYEKAQALLSGAPPKSPEFYRLEVGVERFRVPEIVFQPSLVGIDQMGIVDTLEYMLAEYPADVQKRLADNVFLTGGGVNLPGIEQRLRKELGSCLPHDSTFRIYQNTSPSTEAWCGAAKWARDTTLDSGFLSREEYLERGATGFLKEHKCGNRYRIPPARPVNHPSKTNVAAMANLS